MGEPTGDWDIVQQDPAEYSYYGANTDGVNGLHYANGYWISSFFVLGDAKPVIYSTGLGDTWEEATVSSGGNFTQVAYGQDKYLATDGGALYHATNVASWTQEAWGSGSHIPVAVGFQGGTWALLTYDGEIHTASDPDGPWTLSQQLWPSGATGAIGMRMLRAGDEWLACVEPTGGSYTSGQLFIYAADSLSTSWTGHGLPGSLNYLYGGLGRDASGYFFADFDHVWTASTLGGTWAQSLAYADLYSETSYPYHPYAYMVRYEDGNYVITGRTNSFDLFIAAGPTLDQLTVVKGDVSGQSSRANGLAFDGDDWMIVGNQSPTTTGVYYATAWATEPGGTGWGIVL